MISDEQLSNWTKPAFGNEKDKANFTESAIRDAISSHQLLKTLPIRVFAKGSYKNNTNVRRNSDIDVAVEFTGMIKTDFITGLNFSHSGLEPYKGPDLSIFKSAVGEAMTNIFGVAAVDGSGNKVFKVRAAEKSLEADVIPCVTYHFYDTPLVPRKGIELILDNPDGKRHFNYPDQHNSNGIKKNKATSKRYKSSVRILKNIKEYIKTNGNDGHFPSYMIESLAYNVPDDIYLYAKTWREMIQNICVSAYTYLDKAEPYSDETSRWREVNGHKFLFHPEQNWTRDDAIIFVNSIYGAVAR